jgi:hypothetical protein
MDAMGFGMGCCCLQLTFQSRNIDEARRMYDAMVPLAPILVSLYLGARELRLSAQSTVSIDSCESVVSWICS